MENLNPRHAGRRYPPPACNKSSFDVYPSSPYTLRGATCQFLGLMMAISPKLLVWLNRILKPLGTIAEQRWAVLNHAGSIVGFPQPRALLGSRVSLGRPHFPFIQDGTQILLCCRKQEFCSPVIPRQGGHSGSAPPAVTSLALRIAITPLICMLLDLRTPRDDSPTRMGFRKRGRYVKPCHRTAHLEI